MITLLDLDWLKSEDGQTVLLLLDVIADYLLPIILLLATIIGFTAYAKIKHDNSVKLDIYKIHLNKRFVEAKELYDEWKKSKEQFRNDQKILERKIFHYFHLTRLWKFSRLKFTFRKCIKTYGTSKFKRIDNEMMGMLSEKGQKQAVTSEEKK